MLRFVDLCEFYWTLTSCGEPICAFLSTSDDRFVANDSGQQTFSDMDDIESVVTPDLVARMKALLPEGFFQRRLDLEFADDSPKRSFSGGVVRSGARDLEKDERS